MRFRLRKTMSLFDYAVSGSDLAAYYRQCAIDDPRRAKHWEKEARRADEYTTNLNEPEVLTCEKCGNPSGETDTICDDCWGNEH
jgi:rubrerythrin